MKLYVTRHGETNYNVLGLHNADPKVDVHLTEEGIKQAKELALKLSDTNFDIIYVSELPRTHQTASYINENRDLPVIVDKRLNDVNRGFEGESVAEYHKLRDAAKDPFAYKEPGKESSEDVYERTKDFLRDLQNSSYDKVLIITSMHNFRHFQSIIDGLDPRASLKKHINNSEVLIREIDDLDLQV